jgi:hypothetical protein
LKSTKIQRTNFIKNYLNENLDCGLDKKNRDALEKG